MKKHVICTISILALITLVLYGTVMVVSFRTKEHLSFRVMYARTDLISESSQIVPTLKKYVDDSVSVSSASASAITEEVAVLGAKKDADSVSIVMVGDVLLHMPIEEASKDEDGNYDFNPIFRNMKDEIAAADLAIVNQEVILGGAELGISGYPCFNAPTDIGDALVNTGFDVVLHGTNHALDKGKTGLLNTIEYWKNRHPEILVVGINETQEDKDRIDITTKNGIRIAILNYTYGTNGIPMPQSMPFAVDTLEEAKVKADLAYAEENADFTIVCPHWGTEYNLGTDKSQRRWTEIFREGGADLVLGAHPHVIEPIEFIEDDVPGHGNNHGNGDMLVYYSLGNFVSWTSSEGPGITKRMVGGMAQVTITRNEKGEAVITDNAVEALVAHLSRQHHGVSVYPLSTYTDELAAVNAIDIQDNSFSKQQCLDICNTVWGDNWK